MTRIKINSDKQAAHCTLHTHYHLQIYFQITKKECEELESDSLVSFDRPDADQIENDNEMQYPMSKIQMDDQLANKIKNKRNPETENWRDRRKKVSNALKAEFNVICVIHLVYKHIILMWQKITERGKTTE